MNNESGRIWKELVVTYLKAVSMNLPGGTEENHENLEKSVSRPINWIY
jgi:hypothetical protein